MKPLKIAENDPVEMVRPIRMRHIRNIRSTSAAGQRFSQDTAAAKVAAAKAKAAAAKAKAADAIVEHWERRREAAREDVAMEEMWQQMLLEVVVEAAAEELALAEEERERAETRVGVVTEPDFLPGFLASR